MDTLLPLATFFVALLSSILSGMAGSGGSFIMAPYWLLAGLTPAQGATTGAFMALGLGGGSLAAFRGSEHTVKNKKLIVGFILIALFASLIGPLFLHSISAEAFTPILIGITLLSLPLLFIPKNRIKLGKHSKLLGWFLMAGILLVSSFIASSAFSILMAVVLLQAFNLTILQGTVVRRMIGIIQSAVIFIVLLLLGNFLWQHAVAGLLGGVIGSYIGTKFLLHKGETFAKYALAFGAVLGVAALVVW